MMSWVIYGPSEPQRFHRKLLRGRLGLRYHRDPGSGEKCLSLGTQTASDKAHPSDDLVQSPTKSQYISLELWYFEESSLL